MSFMDIMMELMNLLVHYVDLLTDMYASYIFYLTGTAASAEFILCIVFIMLPHIFGAWLLTFIHESNDPVVKTIPTPLRPLAALSGLYPLYDSIMKFSDPASYISENEYFSSNGGRMFLKAFTIVLQSAPQSVLQLYGLFVTFQTTSVGQSSLIYLPILAY